MVKSIYKIIVDIITCFLLVGLHKIFWNLDEGIL